MSDRNARLSFATGEPRDALSFSPVRWLRILAKRRDMFEGDIDERSNGSVRRGTPWHGQANNPLSRSLAKAGRRVALIERGKIGGTCVNTGCTPTKSMAASARIAYLTRRASEYGVHAGEVHVRLDEVCDRTQAIVEKFSSGSERQLVTTDGLELIRGEGSFTGPRTLRVKLNGGGSRVLAGKMVVIDTGCHPARPDILGLDSVPWLDSTAIMQLGAVPDHLVVLGGGYIGVEFAQMFRRFGSQVTLVQKGANCCPARIRTWPVRSRKFSAKTGSMSS